VSQKKVAPPPQKKNYCNIFTWAKYISAKFSNLLPV